LNSGALSPELLAAAPSCGKNRHAAARSRGGETSKPPSSPSSPSASTPHAHEDHEDHGAQHSHGAHAELEAAWVFHCSAPQALQSLDVGLFRAFSGLRRLDTAVAGPQKQSSARLTPQSSSLKWR
jgi:hypothetical protein